MTLNYCNSCGFVHFPVNIAFKNKGNGLISYLWQKTNVESFFTYCPQCGATNLQFNGHRYHCTDCDFVYFHNIAAAVAVVLKKDDKILFTVRNEEPDKGKWDLPGGFIDPGENAETAVCREIKEELGLVLQPEKIKYLVTAPNNYLYKKIPYRTMDLFFEYELDSETVQITAPDEIKNLIWVPQSEIAIDQIGFVSIQNVMSAYYKK